jgi:hypothetical protein
MISEIEFSSNLSSALTRFPSSAFSIPLNYVPQHQLESIKTHSFAERQCFGNNFYGEFESESDDAAIASDKRGEKGFPSPLEGLSRS